MRGKRTRVSLKLIFQSLRELLRSAIEGREGFIVEIDQEDTYYVVRMFGGNGTVSYFASIQVRTGGVHFQLHTFGELSLLEMPGLHGCSAAKVEPGAVCFTGSIEDCEATLRVLIKKALQEQ